ANTPIWLDTRATEECELIDRAIGREALFAISGNPVKPCYTLPKILWFRKHLPQMYEKAAYVLQSNAFLVYRLTGVVTQDLCQSYGLQCFDMHKGEWNRAILRELNIRETLLPPLFACAQVIGGVSEAAARLTGLKAGTPVVAGGLDAACGSLGAGVYRAGQTQEQGGQAGGMSICVDQYAADPRLILSRHVVPDCWLLQGGTVGGGGALKWLRAQLCPELGFEEMGELARTVAAGSEGLVFLPYLAGERSPIWDVNAKGVFYGLDFTKTRAHMIRAVMEGVAYSLRHNLEVAAEAGAKAEMLYAMGGSANSQVWTQIKSDVTGCAIEVPASDTATTLGAAMLAGVGMGVYDSFEAAVRQTVQLKRAHAPNEANRATYDREYQRYRELYERLKEFEQ
ncbi:MAG: FGGY-family carbohydrate kinase, partial [Clostridia bacterium]